MKKNMGSVDRTIRILVAIVLVALFVSGKISGVLAVVLGIIAGVFLATSLLGWCPGYIPMKFSTRKGPDSTKPAA